MKQISKLIVLSLFLLIASCSQTALIDDPAKQDPGTALTPKQVVNETEEKESASTNTSEGPFADVETQTSTPLTPTPNNASTDLIDDDPLETPSASETIEWESFGPTPPAPREWTSWPIIPHISVRAIQIYHQGIEQGNHPNVFSVVGDCQSVPDVFLGIYATERYQFPEGYAYLEETIYYFEGSFTAERPAVRNGLSVTSALSPLWADPETCLPSESPVVCDLRVIKPSIVFINLGTNWTTGGSAGKYAEYLRQIVEIILENGSLPVLSTKADNIEGDYSINLATVQAAYDYEIPLWNFWSAADYLPGHGLDGDKEGIYLTPDAWDIRNLTGLQVLDAIWKAVQVK